MVDLSKLFSFWVVTTHLAIDIFIGTAFARSIRSREIGLAVQAGRDAFVRRELAAIIERDCADAVRYVRHRFDDSVGYRLFRAIRHMAADQHASLAFKQGDQRAFAVRADYGISFLMAEFLTILNMSRSFFDAGPVRNLVHACTFRAL